MTKRSKDALALVALVGVAALAVMLLAGGGIVRFSAEADAATDAGSWAGEDYGPGYEHLCQPGRMPGRLRHDHPLFTRPARLGGRRAAVAGNGWAWFADAPSEDTL